VSHDRSEDFGATLQGCTQTILQQVRILRGLVTEFSAFARPPASRLESHDPAEIVAAVIEPYQSALPPDVRLSVEIEPGVPRVLADRRLLERGVVNLVERPSGRGRPGPDRREPALEQDRRRVVIEVRDTGPGVTPDARPDLQAFFSTKTSGSGLGLALVKRSRRTTAAAWPPGRRRGRATVAPGGGGGPPGVWQQPQEEAPAAR
jgi:two-component system nitrogen regulation sensor histidine kinase NtrY